MKRGMRMWVVLVSLAVKIATAREAPAAEECPYLLLQELVAVDTHGKTWQFVRPELEYGVGDPVVMYLHFLANDGSGESHWVHYSKIRELRLTPPIGRRQSSPTGVEVLLDDGSGLSGVLRDADFTVRGWGPTGEITFYADRVHLLGSRRPGTQPSWLSAVRFTEFGWFQATPRSLAPELPLQEDCVELPSAQDCTTRYWRDMSPTRLAGLYKYEFLARDGAARFWESHRRPGSRWLATQGNRTLPIEAFGFYYVSNQPGVGLGKQVVTSVLQRVSSEKRIKFTGNIVNGSWVVTVHRDGSVPRVLGVREEEHSDFVFLRKTPYGFAGVSVRSGRRITFTRQADLDGEPTAPERDGTRSSKADARRGRR